MILVAPRVGLSFGLPSWHRPGHAQAGRPAPAVTHCFALKLDAGRSESVPQAACCVMVRCIEGRLWITHDGDPKDVVLDAGESYSAARPATMLVHAMRPSAVEMRFAGGC
jgi:hypothetical protein